jgi:hypothetical protein
MERVYRGRTCEERIYRANERRSNISNILLAIVMAVVDWWRDVRVEEGLDRDTHGCGVVYHQAASRYGVPRAEVLFHGAALMST